MSSSRYLGSRQLRGLDRLGDRFLPGGEGLPSFSESGCAADVDAILEYIPDDDRASLGALLTVLGWVPGFVVSFVVWLTDIAHRVPTPVGALLRFLRIGVRGLVCALYWGHPPVLELIGYEVHVALDEASGEVAQGNVAPSPR